MGLADTQAAFATALAEPTGTPPPGVVTARGKPDATRFAVYRNNVVVGLVSALAARFPVVARLVGERFFRALAREYVFGNKPASPMLFEYGDTLPDFVAAFAPAAEVPYLTDVARLEVAWSRAYNAADAAPLDVARLATRTPRALLAARFDPHPATAILRSEHPVGSIWAAHRREPVEPVADWKPECVLITRPSMSVEVRVVPRGDGLLAESLLAGAPLASAAAGAAEADPDFDVGRAVVGLARLGAFMDIRTKRRTRPS